MDTAVLIVAGWTSGINAYLTLLALGLAGRLGWIDAPGQLERTWVLALCAAAFILELVADKVPYFDAVWNVAHTAIRPVLAGVVGAAGAAMPGATLGRPQAAALAAGLALVGHLSKTSTRLAVNLSPEPATNLLASITEDGVVTALWLLVLASPRVAAVAALVLMVAFAVVGVALFSLARRGLWLVWRQIARARDRV